MLKAVLFDLDDTLLENDIARFAPAYLEAFARRLAELGSFDAMRAALRGAIDSVLRHDDPLVTNDDCFWRELSAQAGLPVDVLRPVVERFCAEDFPSLREWTRRRPEARAVVGQARERGWKIALATNPMFPASVVLQRVEWAGLAVSDFDSITTQDNSHACKPAAAYFFEVLRALDATPVEALMVGDDWRLDIAPAVALGMKTFWVQNRAATSPDGSLLPDAAGTWPEFLAWWNRQP